MNYEDTQAYAIGQAFRLIGETLMDPNSSIEKVVSLNQALELVGLKVMFSIQPDIEQEPK